MKKLLVVLLAAMIAASALVSCSSIGEYTFTQTNSALEAGEDYDLSDCVELQDGFTYEITEDNINIHELGSYPVTFTISDEEGHTAKETLQFEVVDTEPPVFGGETDITINKGDSFNPLDHVTATDNYDGDVSNLIEYNADSFDSEVSGHYDIVLSVSDSNGNTTTETIGLDVSRKFPSEDNTIIRGVCWGDNVDTVVEKEGVEPYLQEHYDDDTSVYTMLTYPNITVAGYSANLFYTVYDNCGLNDFMYWFNSSDIPSSQTFSQYNSIYEALVEKYGEPDESHRENTEPELDLATSLWLGYLNYSDVWYFDVVTINLNVFYYDVNTIIEIVYQNPAVDPTLVSDNL